MNSTDKNISTIDINIDPEYELKLVSKSEETNEEQIINQIKQDIDITYKYYEIAYNNEILEKVNTLEDAEILVNKIKEQKSDDEIQLTISEKYTNNIEEVNTQNLELAVNNIQEVTIAKIEEIKQAKEEEERINSMPVINDIRLAYTPVAGTITSRYGVSSRIRVSTHTGLDIAAKTGTSIKVIADGTITCASYNGSYGNLIKVDHGNGLETWYAHTNKMYVKVGQKVSAGEVIGEVGSTGNSTGPHLHLEIRINGEHVDPQDYLYNE